VAAQQAFARSLMSNISLQARAPFASAAPCLPLSPEQGLNEEQAGHAGKQP
jgi:hypothetical protein